MVGRDDQHQFVPVNKDDGQTGIADRHRHEPEVHRVIDDRIENLAIVGTSDVDCHIGILFLELGEYFGEDVQASAFIGAHNDLAAR